MTQDTRIIKNKSQMDMEQEKKSEHNDVLDSFLNLRHAENEPFSELALKAMESTNIIFRISNERREVEPERQASYETVNPESLISKFKDFKKQGGKELAHDKLLQLIKVLANVRNPTK